HHMLEGDRGRVLWFGRSRVEPVVGSVVRPEHWPSPSVLTARELADKFAFRLPSVNNEGVAAYRCNVWLTGRAAQRPYRGGSDWVRVRIEWIDAEGGIDGVSRGWMKL